MRHVKWIILFAIVLSFVLVPAAAAAPDTHYGCGYWYPVSWGETLYSISRVTGVSTQAIMQANGLSNPNYVQAGSSLWIPCQTPPPPPPPPQCGYWYTVRWGNTMNAISYRTGVNPWVIAQANGIYNINYIYAGQALWIPCPY